MTSPITFKSATQAADAILKADKAKLQWAKLPIDSLPQAIQQQAVDAINAAIAARNAKDALQTMLDNSVDAPSGKRLVVTLGRDVSPSTDHVLYAWASAGSPSTRVVSFEQFVRG